MECLNCSKELVQIEGKRAKQFCNSTCRSNYWQKEKRKEKIKSNLKKGGFTEKQITEIAQNSKKHFEEKKQIVEQKTPFMNDAIRKKLGFKD